MKSLGASCFQQNSQLFGLRVFQSRRFGVTPETDWMQPGWGTVVGVVAGAPTVIDDFRRGLVRWMGDGNPAPTLSRARLRPGGARSWSSANSDTKPWKVGKSIVPAANRAAKCEAFAAPEEEDTSMPEIRFSLA